MASSPKPSATPNVPAGYDLSTNMAPSNHINNVGNGYVPASSGNEDHFNPTRSITVHPNGTVVSAKHAQTSTGNVAGTAHVPAHTPGI